MLRAKLQKFKSKVLVYGKKLTVLSSFIQMHFDKVKTNLFLTERFCRHTPPNALRKPVMLAHSLT